MKRRLVLVAIITLVSQILLVAAPKPKEKDVFLSPCVRYVGHVVKKSPCGTGMLAMYYNNDVSKMDLIQGEFSGETVTNATLWFSHNGPKFKGELEYEVKEDCIIYTLVRGVLSGQKTQAFEINIDNPVSITRKYSDFKLSYTKFSSMVTRETSGGNSSERYVLALARRLEKSRKVTQTFPLVVLMYGINNLNVVYQSDRCNRFDLDNGAYVLRSGNTYELKDSKNSFVAEYSGDVLKQLTFKKHFVDGTLVYDSAVNSSEIGHSFSSYLKHFEPYLSVENKNTLQKLVFMPDASGKTAEYFELRYVDGSRYHGSILTDSSLKSVAGVAISSVFSSTSLDSVFSKENYFDGVLIYPDGSQKVYVKGQTLETVVNNHSKMIKPKLSAKNSNLWAVSWIFGFPFVLSGDVVDVIWESVGPLLDGEPEYYSGEAIALGDKGELKRAALGHTTEYEYNKPKYNASGQIISQSEKSGGLNYQYFYDAEGRLIKMEENSYGDDVTEFVYNDYGYLVKKMEYEDSSLRHYIIYDYDHRGLLLNEREYLENGELLESRTYVYNGNSSEIREVVISYKDGSSCRDKYEYTYNADGTIKYIKVTSSAGSWSGYAVGYTDYPNETGLC